MKVIVHSAKKQVVKLCKEYLLKLSDVMVCASAMIEQAVLLANDKKPHGIDGLQCRALELGA